MNRRQYLAGAVAGSVGFIAGCMNSISGNESTSTPTSTPTPEPNPFESITPSGFGLVVRLTGEPRLRSLQLQNAEGNTVKQATLAETDLKETIELVNRSGGSDMIDSVLSPGDYNLIGVTPQGEQFPQPISLQPDVSITVISFPTELDQLPAGVSEGDMAAYGALAIAIKNSGSLPTLLTESRITGDRVPNPRPAPNDRGNSKLPQLDKPKGAGLNPFSSYSTPTTNTPDVEPLGIGEYGFATEYLPAVIPESKYGSFGFGNAISEVRNDYLDKPIDAAFTLVYGHRGLENSDQTVNFRFRLTGDVKQFGRGPFEDVYAFTDPRVTAFRTGRQG